MSLAAAAALALATPTSVTSKCGLQNYSQTEFTAVSILPGEMYGTEWEGVRP